MIKKYAIIIGAGPAGLTVAYELLLKTDILPIILEQSSDIGGISKTVNYKGNRIDIGGHRFFTKSDRVMDWWLNILPLNKVGEYENDKVMLVQQRLSRIYFLRKFFDYPIALSFNLIKYLGIIRISRIFFSYTYSRIFPIKSELSLEDFFINRFGKSLYKLFFKNYTEKVWGVKCSEISAEWGKQRIKGLSISKAIKHAVLSMFRKKKTIRQKNIETSLIEQFLYPKFGPGQLWEEVANIIIEKGGKIYLNYKARSIVCDNFNVVEIIAENRNLNSRESFKADYFFSTMPVKELIKGISNTVPENVQKVASGLIYRDFITVGLLLNKLKISDKGKLIKDNWIYVQESDVKLGRIQIFNNWSPYMVEDSEKIWLGLEYFCNEGDELWEMTNEQFSKFAIDELSKIDIIEKSEVLDSVVIKMPKTYPAYFGSYNKFNEIKNYINQYENLFLIGRNGMHKYNNQDHSMLTAMIAVENIINKVKDKENIWSVNTEEDYHEET